MKVRERSHWIDAAIPCKTAPVSRRDLPFETETCRGKIRFRKTQHWATFSFKNGSLGDFTITRSSAPQFCVGWCPQNAKSSHLKPISYGFHGFSSFLPGHLLCLERRHLLCLERRHLFQGNFFLHFCQKDARRDSEQNPYPMTSRSRMASPFVKKSIFRLRVWTDGASMYQL